MRFFYIVAIGFIIGGCVPLQKGDYVTYVSDKYVFIENTFVNKSIDCVELGETQEGGLSVKYCVGENYASVPMQGLLFEHDYYNIDERFIGATLSFRGKHRISMPCSSETKDDAAVSGKEYINCMVPQSSFDLYAFIVMSEEDIVGQLKAALGDQHLYTAVIDEEGRALLKRFHKDREEKRRKNWKKRAL